jgi:hypothetical protein
MMTIDNVYGMDDIIGDPIGALQEPTEVSPTPTPQTSRSHDYTWWLWLILVFVIITLGFFFIIHFKK